LSRPARRIPSWLAVTGGGAIGFLAASAGTFAWTAFAKRAEPDVSVARDAGAPVDLFRLPSGAGRELFLVPAGPDANGEPLLAQALFPQENPPRELASLLIANVSPDQSWTFDLGETPLACRRSAAGAWETLKGLTAADAAKLGASDALRLRSLGSAGDRIVVEPKSLRHVLVALPPRCRISDLSDVQWGVTPLVRDRLELERIRRFREDPAAVTTGR
jgi:hypothetical protein